MTTTIQNLSDLQDRRIMMDKKLPPYGYAIDQIDRLLFEAVAWFTIDIACIFTVRTLINRLEIVFREREFFHESFLSCAEIFQFRF